MEDFFSALIAGRLSFSCKLFQSIGLMVYLSFEL